MTQDVQPLTWQKRTNIEEHQQFFSKINEIIGNLAPTVNEAEQAIAQATQAITDANAAITTANAASATADAAAQQAQTAANTVAGYDGRLTAAEGDIDALQAADQTMAGNISALGARMTAAESKNSQQDSAIAAMQTADEQNVKINRINDYAVGLTGNQDNITGIKTFVSGILNITSGNPEIRYYDDRNKTNLLAGVGVRFKTPTSTNTAIRSYAPKINPADNNETQRGGFLQLVSNQDGTITLTVFGTKADGSLTSKVLASFDGTTWS